MERAALSCYVPDMTPETRQQGPTLAALAQGLVRTPARTLLVYALLYAPVGLMNQRLGQWWHLAEFRHDWQVLTCYLLWLVPWSAAVRHLGVGEQYRWGLVCLALIELPGYALGTSIAHPLNLLDRVFGERNFALIMTVGFAAFLPLGNAAVALVEDALAKARAPRAREEEELR
jgi:hypothetical protein